MKEKNGINSKTFILVVAVATLMLSITGATYAYFALSAHNDTAVTGTTARVALKLQVTEQALKTGNTGVMVPQLSAAIPTAINSENKCVDGNNNIVCKVYKITVTNESNAASIVNGTIKFSSYNTSNLRWRRIKTPNTVDTATTGSYAATGVTVAIGHEVDLISGSDCAPASKNCTNVNLAAGASTDYYIVVWLMETSNDQTSVDASTSASVKTFHADVKFEGAGGTGVTSTITS